MSRVIRSIRYRAALGALVLVAASWSTAGAQSPSIEAEPRLVEGRVLLGTAGGERPLADQLVVLHRISADSAGPVDSMRTTRSGAYAFRYRASSASTMYIVSTRYAGIAYFTPPLGEREVRGPEADVAVFDTTSRRIPLTVRGRHFVVSGADPSSGSRRVVDVFEVSNDSAFTLVAGTSGRGTWSMRLPEGVSEPQVGPGDISPDAVRFDNSLATVFAPFSPGVKQVVFSYALGPSAPEVVLAIDQPLGSLEVLVEGEGIVAEGTGVVRQPAAALEGRSFERFFGEDVPAGTVLRFSLPGTPADFGRLRTLGLVALAGFALALGIVYGRRRPPEALESAVAPPADDVEALARAIAALDTVHASRPAAGAAANALHARERAALKARLVAALAAVDVDDKSR